MPAEHLETLTQVLIDVAQESFFSYAVVCPPDAFDQALAVTEAQPGGSGGWVSARVRFAGAFAGAVAIALPWRLATDLACGIAGLMPGDELADSLVVDACGEFANMVCGAWLTRACVHRRFDLQPPQVSQEPAAARPGGDGDVLLLVNDWPVRLTVAFEDAA